LESSSSVPGASGRTPRLQPRWFIVLFWKVHRALVRVTGGRRGLWHPRDKTWGALRLTTVGRRSGQERSVIVGYYEDGPNLVTMAMNGWGEAEPAWWLNLQAHPKARVQLADGTRQVVAHGQLEVLERTADAMAAVLAEVAAAEVQPGAEPVTVTVRVLPASVATGVYTGAVAPGSMTPLENHG
jgi:deazaflavin-dependent oxidoreductase (nitroreductase family)